MKQKICPICDGKLKGNYCPFCHKIVRKPLEWDVRYYLNERHPDWETNCDYHSEPQVLEEAESAESVQQINISPMEKPKKKGRIGKIILSAVGIWVVLNIIMTVIATIDYENPAPDFAEVAERREMGFGDRCDTYLHFPVSYEVFAGKIEDYLANEGLSIDFSDEYTVNLLYSYGEEAEEYSSYNRTTEWYVLEPEMEETDYWSGVSLSSDTASGFLNMPFLFGNMKEKQRYV